MRRNGWIYLGANLKKGVPLSLDVLTFLWIWSLELVRFCYNLSLEGVDS
jgi:hypothetical protein